MPSPLHSKARLPDLKPGFLVLHLAGADGVRPANSLTLPAWATVCFSSRSLTLPGKEAIRKRLLFLLGERMRGRPLHIDTVSFDAAFSALLKSGFLLTCCSFDRDTGEGKQ
jgi:hypothetical protein